MPVSLLVGVPIVLLAIVGVFAFVGCGLDVEGTGAVPYPDEIGLSIRLVAYWRLGDAVGSVLAKDSKDGHDGRYAPDGVLLGAPGLLDGEPDTAAAFNGDEGQVAVAFDPALNDDLGFSAEAWAMLDEQPGTGRTVIASIDAAAHRGYAITAGASGTWQATLGDGSTWHVLDSGAAVKQGARTYLLLAYGGGRATLWVDAPYDETPKLSIAHFAANTSKELLIAGPGPDGALPFKGTLDEVAVYDGVLGQTDALAHYAANTQRLPADAPEVVIQSPQIVTATTATLRGTVNPNGHATKYHFEYGEAVLAVSDLTHTPDTDAGFGSTTEQVNAAITGLKPGTDYQYRLVATGAGTRNTPVRRFRTSP